MGKQDKAAYKKKKKKRGREKQYLWSSESKNETHHKSPLGLGEKTTTISKFPRLLPQVSAVSDASHLSFLNNVHLIEEVQAFSHRNWVVRYSI